MRRNSGSIRLGCEQVASDAENASGQLGGVSQRLRSRTQAKVMLS